MPQSSDPRYRAFRRVSAETLKHIADYLQAEMQEWQSIVSQLSAHKSGYMRALGLSLLLFGEWAFGHAQEIIKSGRNPFDPIPQPNPPAGSPGQRPRPAAARP
jgi:hypothetical protein